MILLLRPSRSLAPGSASNHLSLETKASESHTHDNLVLRFDGQIKDNSQILNLGCCRLDTLVLEVYQKTTLANSKGPFYVASNTIYLPQFVIEVRCNFQSMTSDKASELWNNCFTSDSVFSFLMYIPRLCDRTLDDAGVSIIFVSQSLEHFAFEAEHNEACSALFQHCISSLCAIVF